VFCIGRVIFHGVHPVTGLEDSERA